MQGHDINYGPEVHLAGGARGGGGGGDCPPHPAQQQQQYAPPPAQPSYAPQRRSYTEPWQHHQKSGLAVPAPSFVLGGQVDADLDDDWGMAAYGTPTVVRQQLPSSAQQHNQQPYGSMLPVQQHSRAWPSAQQQVQRPSPTASVEPPSFTPQQHAEPYAFAPPPQSAPSPPLPTATTDTPEFRLAFANLQSKQIQLRIAEEHRRAREAELEILRLREVERQRAMSASTQGSGSSACGAIDLDSARSSYSSGGTTVPYRRYPQPGAQAAYAASVGQRSLEATIPSAPHINPAAASTPSSTASYSHVFPTVDKQQSSAFMFGPEYDVVRGGGAYLNVPQDPSRVPSPSSHLQPNISLQPLGGYPIDLQDIQDTPLLNPSGPAYSYPHDPLQAVPPGDPHAPTQQQPPLYSYQPVPVLHTAYDSATPSRSPADEQPSGLSLQGGASRLSKPLALSRKQSAVESPKPRPTPLPSPRPPATGGKKKRILVQDHPPASCSQCRAPIAHLLLRGEGEHFWVEWEGFWMCKACMGEDFALEEGSRRRKRVRDTQDLEAPLTCDVCCQLKGKGGIVAKDSKSPILFSTEFVCVTCEGKYRRCTDCGGGGGGRIGIGKWRSKELFMAGRKTCNLFHTRIGNAPLVNGVWSSKELWDEDVREALREKCESLWKDKLLTRLAIPEILEVESTPPRSYKHIRDAIDEGWPDRNALFEGFDAPYDEEKRRYFGLTWCKTKPRRPTQSELAEDESPPPPEVTAETSPLDKLNRTDIIPPGHELVGLFVGHWRMNDGTLLITTSLPFESTDGDDRNALAIGEVACKIVAEIDEINSRRIEQHHAGLTAGELRLLPALEHLYVLCDNADPDIRERMRDLLHRRRQFYILDEYIRLHPHVDPALFHKHVAHSPHPTRPGWVMGNVIDQEDCDIMVRWLGPHFDRQRLEEITNSEFSKRLKSKKAASKG